MTMMTVTLRNSGHQIVIDFEHVAHFAPREWGTVLNFMKFVEKGELVDEIEVRETFKEMLDHRERVKALAADIGEQQDDD